MDLLVFWIVLVLILCICRDTYNNYKSNKIAKQAQQILGYYTNLFEKDINNALRDQILFGTGAVEVKWDDKTNDVSVNHVPWSKLYEQKTRPRAKSSSTINRRKSKLKTRSKKLKKLNTKTKSRVR